MARSMEDDRCCVKEGSLVRVGTPELELVWFSNEPLPIQLMPIESKGVKMEYGAKLLAILEVDGSSKSPLKLLRPRDIVRTIWLPGASMPCAANKLEFSAILRAVMEGGDREHPLVLTFGPPAAQPWEKKGHITPSTSTLLRNELSSPNRNASTKTPISDGSPIATTTDNFNTPTSTTARGGGGVSDPLNKAMGLTGALTGWLTEAGAGVAEKMDTLKSESSETWQKVVSPGWLNPEPALKIDREIREKRRKEELMKREKDNLTQPREGSKAARAAEMRRKRLAREAVSEQLKNERKEKIKNNGVPNSKNKQAAMAHLLVCWVNNVLCDEEDDELVIRSLEKDLRSGVVLYQLCEKLSGVSLSSYGKLVLPSSGQKFVKNISSLSNFFAVFRFLREHFRLPDHDDDLSSEVVNEVIDGEVGVTVNLLWLIAVLFTSEKLGLKVECVGKESENTNIVGVTENDSLRNDEGSQEKNREDEGVDDNDDDKDDNEKIDEGIEEEGAPHLEEKVSLLEMEEDSLDFTDDFSSIAQALDLHKRHIRRYLMRWCRNRLRPFQHIAIHGLGRPSFKDGRAILALVSSFDPESCPYTPIGVEEATATASASASNFSAAMHAARSLFGCKLLFSPNTDTDFLLADCPSEVLLLLVSQLKLKCPHYDKDVCLNELNLDQTEEDYDDGNEENEEDNKIENHQYEIDNENNLQNISTNSSADDEMADKSEYVYVVVTLIGARGVPMRSNAKAAVRVGTAKSAWHATPTTHHNPCPQWQFTCTSMVKLSQLSKTEKYIDVSDNKHAQKSDDDDDDDNEEEEEGNVDENEDDHGSDLQSTAIELKKKRIKTWVLSLPLWFKLYSVLEEDDILLASLNTHFELTLKPQLLLNSKQANDNSNNDDDIEVIWPPTQICANKMNISLKDCLISNKNIQKPVSSPNSSSSNFKVKKNFKSTDDSDATISDSDDDNDDKDNDEDDNTSISGINLQVSVAVLDLGKLSSYLKGSYSLKDISIIEKKLKLKLNQELIFKNKKLTRLEIENHKLKKAVGRIKTLAEDNVALKKRIKELELLQENIGIEC